MAKAKNKVIAGDFEGANLKISFGNIYLSSPTANLTLDKGIIDSYEIVDASKAKSASSAVVRGAVGSMLLGPVGIAAALSAKSKGVHIIAIQFRSGKSSLLEIDDKLYKELMKKLF